MNAIIERFANTRCWTNYKIVKKDGRITKPPCNAAGIAFNSFDNNNVLTFDHATSNVSANAKITGVGTAFILDGLLVGVDLDDIISNGVITDETAKRFISEAKSYTEITPSGEGAHVLLWVHGVDKLEKISPNRHGKFEVYNAERYFTFTGKVIDGYNQLREVSVNELIELLMIIGWPWGKDASIKPTANDDLDFYDTCDIEDVNLPTGATFSNNAKWDYYNNDDLRKLMFATRHGADIKSAHDGTLRDDKSANDYAYIRHLGFYTGHDKGRSKVMFLESPTGQRDKAKREDYFDRTWDAAIKSLGGNRFVFKPNAAQPAQPMPDEVETSQEGSAAIVVTRESDDSALLETNRTSAGMGDNFVRLHGDDIKFEVASEQWIAYLDHRWQYDTTRFARRLMRQTAQRAYRACINIKDLKQRQEASKFFINSETDKAIGEALKSAATNEGMQVNIADFDNDPFLANAGDYTLDLKNCYARPSRKEDFLTLRLGTTFDKDAKCPRWRQFISEIFPNQELGEFFQRCIGYSFTGNMREQKLFLLHGDGCNGKSLCLKILGKVAGDYGTAMPSSTFDADERSNVQQELFEARGKRFIAVVETDENKRLSEGLVKSLTGQDLITARKLFAQPIKYYPTFKFWIAMNHLPRISGIDTGIWRRLILIPFTQSFLGREETGLEDVLMAEASGILNWILEGVVNWHKHGLKPPESVINAVSNYRKSEDITAQWLADCTTPNPLGQVQSSVAFKSFMEWAQSSNVRTAISQTKFSLMLQQSGFEVVTRGGGKRFFTGFNISPL